MVFTGNQNPETGDILKFPLHYRRPERSEGSQEKSNVRRIIIGINANIE